MEAQENVWEKILSIEKERQKEITALCQKLIDAIPAEFPAALLESMGGELKSLTCGEMSFDRWLKAFVIEGSCEVQLHSYQLKGYLNKLDRSWKSMRDVEFAFDCLSFAWKPFINMRTELEEIRIKKGRKTQHFERLHIYFAIS